MSKFPVTQIGFDKIKEELHHLKYVDMPNITASIAEAREFGDLSENAEYHAAREKQSLTVARMSDLEDKMARAEIIDISKISSDKVTFGATVKMRDDDTEEEITYMIVGEYEANISKNRISIISPLAKSLIGKKIGEFAEVTTPKTEKVYEVLDIKYIELKEL